MRILVIDKDASALEFCLRCQAAGHEMRWFTVADRPSKPNTEGDGLIKRTDNWRGFMDWADLIYLTGNAKYMEMLQPYRDRGLPIFGPSVNSARLEIDRRYGLEMMVRAGIDVPAYEVFKTLKDAQRHVIKADERYVFKTLGDNDDKSLSYVSKSPEDMYAKIQRWIDLELDPKGEVMLQTFVDGIEMGVAGYFAPSGWIGTWNEDFEYKKLMSGNYGMNTGEMGTVCQFVGSSRLAEELLVPCTALLHEVDHVGDVNINAKIDRNGKAWPLEWTARPGWPYSNLALELIVGDPAQWMKDALRGKQSMQVIYDAALGVVVAQPDFPYSKATGRALNDVPIFGITEETRHYYQLVGAKQGKVPSITRGQLSMHDGLVTADDYVMVVTATAPSIREARKDAYAMVDALCIPNMLVRDDIGQDLERKLPKLQKLGYATEFTW